MRKPGKIITILFNAAIFIILEVAALGMLRSGKAQDFFISKGAHAFMAKILLLPQTGQRTAGGAELRADPGTARLAA